MLLRCIKYGYAEDRSNKSEKLNHLNSSTFTQRHITVYLNCNVSTRIEYELNTLTS